MEKLKGIDISEFNGEIDFKKVKKEVDFIYIRATYGRFGIDKRFKEYAEECIKNEIPFGFYYYSYAVDLETAEAEVKFFLEQIKDYKEEMTFPAMIDMEDADGYKYNHGKPSKEMLSDICILACEKIAENNISPIIYASADWFKNRLDSEKLVGFMKWIAWWNAEEKNINNKIYSIWQYSSKGKINGIKGNVDLDYSFVNFKLLKEYVKNISKMNLIKSKTLLSDLELQYISCYKWGQDLINKIYNCLNKEKIEFNEKFDYDKKLKAVGKYFGLEAKTINYLYLFIHSESMISKLYKFITSENVIKISEE